ncbi:MAG: hypothetical protein V4615_00555 [Bacteroidota bacterium]
MKKGLLFLVAVIVLGAVGALSFLKGVDMVRDGLIANYPTVKYVVQGATVEFFDSLLVTTLVKADNEELFSLLKGDSKSDTLQFAIPYYARYGVDLSVRNFRLFRDGQTVELWLPQSKLLYCELRFERMFVDGKLASSALKGDSYALLKNKLYEHIVPLLEKNKANQKAAKKTVAKAVMFYFMPYKFDLKLYINNEQQTLPKVPGVNQTVDEAINEMLGK